MDRLPPLMRGFAAAMLMLAAHVPLAAQPTPDLIPIEDLAALPAISGPMLSPDGNRILAYVNLAGEERLAIFDLAAPAGTRPRLIESENEVTWYRWAGNGRVLVGVTREANVVGQQLPFSRVVALDLASNRAAVIDSRAGFGLLGDDVIYVDPDGTHMLLAAQPDLFTEPNVYRVDLSTRRLEIVERNRSGVWNWFADESGIVRAGVDYGERRIRFFYRARPDEPLRRIETRRYTQDDSVIEMIRFVADTDRGVVVTNSETGRFALYEYDFATDTRGAALFEHPEVDITAPIIGPGDRVDGVSYEDDRPRVRWFNEEFARLQRLLDRSLPDKTNVILNRSRDGNRILVWSGGAADPGGYYVYDRAARRLDGFAQPFEQLAERTLAPVRHVRYANREGLSIPAYLTLPPGREERGLPLVVMPHGGPFARDSWAFNAQVQFLANRGYAVLQPNFRGSTGYGREFVERGFGQLGAGMIDDIEAGVDWLAGQGIVDPARVCIMGGSYGGYAALWSAVRSASRYRCAISFAGVSDLRALLRHDARFVLPRRYMREWRRRVQGEESLDLDAISPLRQAARVAVPVLIAHGELDRRVPVSQSRDLARALNRRGAAVEAVFYREAGHGFSRAEDQADFLRRVEAFLARHNPAGPPAPAAAPAGGGGVPIGGPSR
jgi:dipeptidyl aminopeptidase/acylaminoacyl peptidase